MKKLIGNLLIIVIGLFLTFTSGCSGGRLFFKMGQDNIIVDKNGYAPIYSEILSDELMEIDGIKTLSISCDLTDIEIEENEDNNFVLEIINIDSKEASKIEYRNEEHEVTISNKSLGNKKLGTFDENSTKYKVILKGPIHEVEALSVNSSVGSITINGVKAKNLFVEQYASSLEINDSVLEDLNMDIVFSDVDINSSKIKDLNMDIETSRIFGSNIEFYGANNIRASKVTGQIGIDNYKDVAVGEIVAGKERLDIDAKMSKIDIIDENNFYNEGD